jgi:hypothetical protein
MIANALIAARVTADTKQRFAAVARQQRLSELTLLKLSDVSTQRYCPLARSSRGLPNPSSRTFEGRRTAIPGELPVALWAGFSALPGKREQWQGAARDARPREYIDEAQIFALWVDRLLAARSGTRQH